MKKNNFWDFWEFCLLKLNVLSIIEFLKVFFNLIQCCNNLHYNIRLKNLKNPLIFAASYTYFFSKIKKYDEGEKERKFTKQKLNFFMIPSGFSNLSLSGILFL